MRQYLPNPVFVGTAQDDFAYWREIESRWGLDDLLIVEHDVELHEWAVPQFRECPELWCSFSYEIMPGILLDEGTGCVRFRREAQLAAPVERIQAVPGSCHRCMGKPGCWAHIDARIAEVMKAVGISVHVHRPPVIHYLG